MILQAILQYLALTSLYTKLEFHNALYVEFDIFYIFWIL